MRLLILFFAISRLCDCSLPYYGVTVGITPYSRPVQTQYHSQDNYGHYVYGYSTDLSSQDEAKTPDGVTRGGYSYIDANGVLQTVQYVSDPVHGFRVLATNIPHDVPAVAHARAQHLAQFEHIKAEHAYIAASQRHSPAAISPLPAPGHYIVPVQTAPVVVSHIRTPVAAVLPIAPPVAVAVSSQYHAQDTLGQYSYGYADPLSSKSETKTADGVTRGGYSYIDANGVVQTVQYISDPVNGFRVAATNLPQAQSVTLIGPKVSATVVGPKDNNAGSVAVVPASDAVNVVPVHSTHIDSIGYEQSPLVAQTDIVPNANVPFANPAGPYIHPNPNHGPPAVYANPDDAHQLYAAGPIPVTHSEAVFAHDKGPVFTAPPALENVHHQQQFAYNPEHAHQAIAHNADYIQHQGQPQQILLAPEHVPQHAGHPSIALDHNQEYVQYQGQQDQILHANQPSVAQNHEYEYVQQPDQIVHADQPEYIQSDQILHGDNRGQVFAITDPNLAHAAHPIPLARHELPTPSGAYGASYARQPVPINADAINNGPINQQVLNHGPTPLAYQPAHSDGQYALYANADANAAVQQVQHGAPVGEQRPAFVVRVAEHASSARDEGPHGTAPSGYYTQNIQY